MKSDNNFIDEAESFANQLAIEQALQLQKYNNTDQYNNIIYEEK